MCCYSSILYHIIFVCILYRHNFNLTYYFLNQSKNSELKNIFQIKFVAHLRVKRVPSKIHVLIIDSGILIFGLRWNTIHEHNTYYNIYMTWMVLIHYCRSLVFLYYNIMIGIIWCRTAVSWKKYYMHITWVYPIPILCIPGVPFNVSTLYFKNY